MSLQTSGYLRYVTPFWKIADINARSCNRHFPSIYNLKRRKAKRLHQTKNIYLWKHEILIPLSGILKASHLLAIRTSISCYFYPEPQLEYMWLNSRGDLILIFAMLHLPTSCVTNSIVYNFIYLHKYALCIVFCERIGFISRASCSWMNKKYQNIKNIKEICMERIKISFK